MGAIMTNEFVYEVYVHDDFPDEPLRFMERYQAFEAAKHYANEDNEPIIIAVRLHGSTKRICELTIYPDVKEDESC